MPKTTEHFFNTVQDRAWALHPAKLEEVSHFIELRLSGDKITLPETAAGKSGNRAEKPYEVIDGVAVLPLYGIIDKRMNLLMHISGGTSTELLARDFQKALADPQVQAILLDVDSPGGSVDGTKELADLVFASRGVKPVVAYANGLMASAAYWIGSAADAIVAMESAEIGSIGVALMHYDYSAQDEKLGVKRTAITAGKYKRIASDEKPLSREGQEYLQGMVDDYYDLFLEAVGRHRAMDPEAVHDKMADGRIFIGKKALKVKLVDQIGNFNDALALARERGDSMTAILTKENLQAENPELFKDIYDSGRQAGQAAGVATERQRVVDLLAKNGDPEVTRQAIVNGTSVAEAGWLFFEAAQQAQQQRLADLETSAPASLGQAPPVTATTGSADDQLDAKARERAKEKGINLDVAMEEVMAENPELVARWNPAAGI